ncbi:hypothetical protein GUJ93_ZPchr0004g38688 [Zizania palustris]|uniref:Uncharacterized protein n=1 Tax=Zizania palustris TaxID=103762 RepID=A0A8J5T0P7_ZIZPA|nr:hypothetical protein GUJ93_ZPchr0004g38688 [Zizania palustris]
MEEHAPSSPSPRGGLEVAPIVETERSEPEVAIADSKPGAPEVVIVDSELGASQTHQRGAGLFMALECPDLSPIVEEDEDAARVVEVRHNVVDLEGSSGDSEDSSSGSNSEESDEDPLGEGGNEGASDEASLLAPSEDVAKVLDVIDRSSAPEAYSNRVPVPRPFVLPEVPTGELISRYL